MQCAHHRSDSFADMASTTIDHYRFDFISFGINGATYTNDSAITTKVIGNLLLITLLM